jgi:hypothetical protein
MVGEPSKHKSLGGKQNWLCRKDSKEASEAVGVGGRIRRWQKMQSLVGPL